MCELTGLNAIFRLLNVHGGIAYCLLRRTIKLSSRTNNISKRGCIAYEDQTDDLSFNEKISVLHLL